MSADFVIDQNIQGDLMGLAANNGQARHSSKGSRAEFEKHFNSMPAHIRAELRSARLRLGDTLIYSIKPVGSSQTIKMFETQDQKQTNLRNVSNGKLPKNQALLVSGIYILAGIAPAAIAGAPTEGEVAATPFGSIDTTAYAAIANGEFNLKSNKRTIVPETSMRLWCTDNNSLYPIGFYKLDNPRPIADDELMEATLELGSLKNIPQDTMIYVGLFGTITTP